MLDAPLSGSPVTVKQGNASLMIGGDKTTFERIENVLRVIGPKVTYIGASGQAVNGWTVVVAIVDPGGHLVYLEKLDETQVGSVPIAEAKARSAAIFKRPTRMFQERLARGGDGLLVLRLQDAMPVEGGVPIISGGKLIGALGISSGSSAEDEFCAAAGVAALD